MAEKAPATAKPSLQDLTKSEIKVDTKPAFHKVRYVPHDGDPVKVMWNGIAFRANVDVEVPITTVIHQEKDRAPIPLVELARTNGHFSVDGEPPPKKSNKPPQTSDEYRRWAINWIALADDFDHLAMRWDEEERLRHMCGIGQDDMDMLLSVYSPKLERLKMQRQMYAQ